ncbi:ABC transporter ATP-binding protein, partial [bacterium]|nr:ABC transporter ATP-binding protein [bacterium]
MKQLFKRYIKKYLLILIACLLMAIGFVVSQLFIPIYVGRSIDSAVKFGFNDQIIDYILIISCLILINFIFQYLFDLTTSIFNQNVIYELRKDLFTKYNFVPISFIDSKLKGDLVSRSINDVENICVGLLGGFRQLFQGIVLIVGTLCFMFGVNWFLGLIVVFITPLSIFVSSFIAKKCNKYFKKQAGSAGNLSYKSFEALNNYETISAYNYEETLIEKYEEANNELYKSGQKAQFYSSWINPTTRFINNITYAMVLMAGVLLLIYPDFSNQIGLGLFTVGGLQSVLVYANQYAKPFNEISSVTTEIQNAMASLKRVSEILNEENEIDSNEKYSCSAEILKFEDVDFGYSSDKLVLENLNFSIKKGERIAIVGPTGCGKT